MSKKYVASLNRVRVLVLLFWLVLAVAAIPGVLTLFDHLGMAYNAPEGTRAAKARHLFEQEFAREPYENTVIILQRDNGQTVITEEAAQFTKALVSAITDSPVMKGQVAPDSFMGYFLLLGTPIDQQDPTAKMHFVSSDNDTMLVDLKVNYGQRGNEIVTALRDIVHRATPQGYASYLVCEPAMTKDTMKIVIRDIERINVIAVPLIIVVLFLLFRNVKLVPVPLVAIGIVLLFAMGIISVIARFTQVLAFVPTIVSCLGLGVGIDYSVFMLSRFQEERRRGRSPHVATEIMVKRAGFTILASALTLGTAFVGLVFFPMDLISGIGSAIALVVGLTLINNLVFLPALTLLMGGWLCPDGTVGDARTDSCGDAEAKRTKPSFWRRSGAFSTRYAVAITIVTLLLAIPVALRLTDLTVSDNQDDLLPYDTPSGLAYQKMKSEFGSAMLSPLEIVVKPKSPADIWGREFYNSTVQFIAALQNDREVKSESLMSMLCMQGHLVPYEGIAFARSFSGMDGARQNAALQQLDKSIRLSAQSYLRAFGSYVSSRQDAIKITLFLSVDPLSQEAKNWLKKARSDYVQTAYGDTAEVGFACRTAESLDTVDSAFQIFPWMVVAVLVVIYVIIGLMFRSAIIPLRLLITVALTISFIFGMFDLVFLHHWGAFLIPQIENIEGLFWILPIIAFCVIVGLGLDYELFILSRVKEAVWTGRTTREGIQDSLECTGKLVTGAGAIMIVSFGGMMFSTMVPLIEIGFIMGFAILVDATVVRILLVPALMSIADQWNWWPSRPPTKEDLAARTKEGTADSVPLKTHVS
ncbi:MAG: MMPL family transporter [Sedimentisphaerales bacterium]|nr:MMPL family transporter [Sedimentisphaerales bacterium]